MLFHLYPSSTIPQYLIQSFQIEDLLKDVKLLIFYDFFFSLIDLVLFDIGVDEKLLTLGLFFLLGILVREKRFVGLLSLFT
jgi:hypothetical protein